MHADIPRVPTYGVTDTADSDLPLVASYLFLHSYIHTYIDTYICIWERGYISGYTGFFD